MFALRHIGRGTFHAGHRFHIEGGWHWLHAFLSVGFWAAMLWGAWQGQLLVSTAVAQVDELTTRPAADDEYIELFFVLLIVTLAALVLILDVAARLVAELCLWTASSLWRFRGVRELSATALAALERHILRRAPEWHVELAYPRARQSIASVAPLLVSREGRRIGLRDPAPASNDPQRT